MNDANEAKEAKETNEVIDGKSMNNPKTKDTLTLPRPSSLAKTALGWLRGYLDYRNLDSFIGKEMESRSLYESAPIIVFAQIILMSAMTFAFALSAVISPEIVLPNLGVYLTAMVLIALIGGILVFYLSMGLTFAVSRLIGGSGTIESQARVLSITALCSNVVKSPVALAGLFFTDSATPAGFVVMLAVTMIGLYEMFATYKTVRVVHGLSSLKSIAVVIGTALVLYLAASQIMGPLA